MENLSHNTVVVPAIGIDQDSHPADVKEGFYTRAINATLNAGLGKKGKLTNEPSNALIGALPAGLTCNGIIPLPDGRRHFVCSTDDVVSELGILDEETGQYTKLVSSTELGLKKSHIVSGISRENHKCEELVYFVDGINPNRVLNLNNIPYRYTIKQVPGQCDEKVYTNQLDVDALLWTPKISYPKISVSAAPDGNLPNGTYQFAVAYSENKQRFTDWFSVTNPEHGIVFSHENRGGALQVQIENLDRDFDEYALAVIYTVNQQTTAEIVGYFSTGQSRVLVTRVGNSAIGQLPIPLSDIVRSSVYYEKADGVVASNGYAILLSPSQPKEINYQPQANNIVTKWIAVKKPLDYYEKGGTETGHPRDEVIAPAIQWLRDSGHWTPAYHIPGRVASQSERQVYNGPDVFEFELEQKPEKVYKWQAVNTATIEKIHNKDGVWAEGLPGYYESTERYPDNPYLWGDNTCQPVRFHRMPDASLVPLNDENSIYLLGLKFENIEHPKDENGNYVSGIIGYRIVMGDRTVEKSIQANGIVLNMRTYQKDGKEHLFQNYPFNDLRPDPYLSTTPTSRSTSNQERNFNAFSGYRKDVFSFYSPNTCFGKPALGTEFRIYNEVVGDAIGRFEHVYKHPRHKLIRNSALLAAAAVGFGEGILATKGKTVYEKQNPTKIKLFITKQTATDAGTVTTNNATDIDLEGISENALKQIILSAGGNIAPNTVENIITLLKGKSKAPLGPTDTGLVHGSKKITTETAFQNIPILSIGPKVLAFGYFFAQGVSTALNVIKAFVNWEQYAYQYNAHCFFNRSLKIKDGNSRRRITHYEYLYPIVQEANGVTINNYKRSSSVVLFLNKAINDPTTRDTSRQTLSTAQKCNDKFGTVVTVASAFYGAVKRQLPNQYGQVDGIKYIDTGYKEVVLSSVSPDPDKKIYSTGVVLGGGARITRMTVKNKMHFFNQTAFSEKDGYELDYRKYANIPNPRFWINSHEYDVSDLLKLDLPTDLHNLDCRTKETVAKKISAPFLIKDAAFYLFCNGVLDFFVESEYDLTKRDWEDTLQGQHYDEKRYTDLSSLFRHDIYDFDNKYLYDKTFLKVNEENYIPSQDQSIVGPDPCGTKLVNRVVYSLPNIQGSKKDNWRSFPANNYWDFDKENGRITGVLPIGKTSILFTFENGAPQLHQTIDTLRTGSGNEVTIGDGTLFSRQPQSELNTGYAYGSNNSRFANCVTDYGVVYCSQKNGNVFIYTDRLRELTNDQDSYVYSWFQKYLPSRLLAQFPDFPDGDNPFTGVGVMSVYDPTLKILYISKKDFKAMSGVVWNTGRNRFEFSGVPVQLGDPRYFIDCSWTVSFDLKTRKLISFHDWHPDFLIQTNRHFLSIKDGFIWKHNERCDSYCNFYGVQHPFEVEYVVSNRGIVGILSSIEYDLEAFEFKDNCVDYFQLPDYNFNRALIFNDEEISGWLRLFLKNKRGPADLLVYPRYNTDSIDILYTKEEQRVRFNQFADMCADRGEFSGRKIHLVETAEDGYHIQVNRQAVSYKKRQRFRRQFRNNWFRVVLRKVVEEGEVMPQMQLNFVINKQVKSIR